LKCNGEEEDVREDARGAEEGEERGGDLGRMYEDE
jgi:hypothetical protein